MRLLLASASPRRRDLLTAAGVAVDVCSVDVDETPVSDEPPDAYVSRLARTKADVAAAQTAARPVLAADTAVVVDGRILGKPADAADAARMLRLLSGRAHEVVTGVALVHSRGTDVRVERTVVWMEPLGEAAIAWYVASGEPMGKAGAYAIQGLASRFIPRIEGSYTNVVGLPVAAVLHLLEAAGCLPWSTGQSPARPEGGCS